MKFSAVTAVMALGAQVVYGYPGMGATIGQIKSKVARDMNSPLSTELLGDLRGMRDNSLTRTGRDVKQLLMGGGDPESDVRYVMKPRLEGWWCQVDTCCVWQHIADDLEELFRGESGRCTRLARQAVRIGFHDAGCWSKDTDAQGGGADGSIILSDELSRIENSGMSDMGAEYRRIYDHYHNELGFANVGMADLVQLGANVATVVCPLGPRIRTFVGRQDNSRPAPSGLLPNPFADADSLIELFANKTISARGLVALLGSHTTSQQNFINTTRAGDPQDSTPGVWDNLFFRETMRRGPVPNRVYHLASDTALARHATTRSDFEMYGAEQGGQQLWNRDYAREAIRLSLLGVNNINTMTECTRVLPRATHNFRNQDQTMLDRWLSGVERSPFWNEVSRFIEEGRRADRVGSSRN